MDAAGHARQSATMRPDPIVLEGRHVRLEPLDLSVHWSGLAAIGTEPALWRFTTAKVADETGLRRYLERAAHELATGLALPFAVRHRASGAIAGCTRFGNFAPEHRRVEIGWTWVGRPYQRTAVNTEQKRLMFGHAFDTWGAQRVELKTSSLNEPSKAAMRRLGLIEEGTLRKHMLNEDGTARHSVYFSATDDDWPALRARLDAMLAAD